MTKSTNDINADISMNGQKIKVTSFKFFGTTLCKDGTWAAEICIRIASVSNVSDSQHDLAKQHDQPRKEVQV